MTSIMSNKKYARNLHRLRRVAHIYEDSFMLATQLYQAWLWNGSTRQIIFELLISIFHTKLASLILNSDYSFTGTSRACYSSSRPRWWNKLWLVIGSYWINIFFSQLAFPHHSVRSRVLSCDFDSLPKWPQFYTTPHLICQRLDGHG